MILSIIIPCYNAEPYIYNLLDCLHRQMAKNVEVICIDDGSKVPVKTDYKWCKVIRKKNGGVSSARNMGLDIATGDYITFIDADDLVSDRYIGTILEKIRTEHFDYCYLSWKSKGSWLCDVKLNTIDDTFPSFNLCVWNRVYKRDLIGNTRFNTKKAIAEDAEFIRDIEHGKKAFISDYMYFYNSDTPDSLTKRFRTGDLDTQRIVYNIPHITKDMDYLIDEVAKADADAEVIIMTDRNDIPKLEAHAMIIKPSKIYGTELRGTPTSLFSKIDMPYHTQVVIYTARTFKIGGIETFIYNFCIHMKDLYDILVLYDEIDAEQLARLRMLVECRKLDGKRIICDTLIVNRISDKAPACVRYNKRIQMVHACRMVPAWKIPQDNDVQICVSHAVEDSFAQDLRDNHLVIHNLIAPQKTKKVLRLISATRLSTFEKGKARMKQLVDALAQAGIDYIWLCFSDTPADEGIITMKPRLNITSYIKDADYLVQLSDAEAFCYSIVEALNVGTPVITTPLPVLDELGFEDGKHGYVVPFDMQGIDVVKIYKHIPKFKYEYDNAKAIEDWRKVLGDTTPTGRYNPKNMALVRALMTYKDMELNMIINQGQMVTMRKERAKVLVDKSIVEIVN